VGGLAMRPARARVYQVTRASSHFRCDHENPQREFSAPDPPAALAPNRTTLRHFSKQCDRAGNRWLRGRRCHGRVTTACEFGNTAGDGLRRFRLVRTVRESLRDRTIQPMSDWGSSGRQSHHRDASITAPLLMQREHSGEPIDGKSVQPISVCSIHFTCDKATTARTDVQLALGVSSQIVIPRGMPRTSVIRSNQYHVTSVSEVSQRNLTPLAAASTNRSQHHHRQSGAERQPTAGCLHHRRLKRHSHPPQDRQRRLASREPTAHPPRQPTSPRTACLQVDAADAIDRVVGGHSDLMVSNTLNHHRQTSKTPPG
jgi:hypothetical protein